MFRGDLAAWCQSREQEPGDKRPAARCTAEARFAMEVTHLAGERRLRWRRNAADLLQLARPPPITPVASSEAPAYLAGHTDALLRGRDRHASGRHCADQVRDPFEKMCPLIAPRKQFSQLVTGGYEPVAAHGNILLYRRVGAAGAIVIDAQSRRGSRLDFVELYRRRPRNPALHAYGSTGGSASKARSSCAPRKVRS
jgi:hypothetical protein